MKKILLTALLVIMILGLAGCGGNVDSGSVSADSGASIEIPTAEQEWEVFNYYGLTIDVGTTWRKDEAENDTDNIRFYFSDDDPEATLPMIWDFLFDFG